MSAVKETREFFLRNVEVPTGLNADQEAAYPTQYFVGTTLVYNRFLKNNYPSEGVYKKLFESLTFKLNKEDTASEATQGLAKKATDAHAKAGNSPADGFTRFVIPSQLPVVVPGANTTDAISLSNSPDMPTDMVAVTTDSAVTTRNSFKVGISATFIGWLKNTFNRVVTYVNTIDVIDGVVTYPSDAADQDKVIIVKTPASNDVGAKFKVNVQLKPSQTVDTGAIITQCTSAVLASINVMSLLPIGFTSDITDSTILNAEFDMTTGLAKNGSPWTGWGIVGIANGTANAKGRTPRYIDLGDNNFKIVGSVGGQDNVVLVAGQLPKHRHGYGYQSANKGPLEDDRANNPFGGARGNFFAGDTPVFNDNGFNTSGGAGDNWGREFNTGDGTDTVGGQAGGLKSSNDAVTLINKYITFAKVVKLV